MDDYDFDFIANRQGSASLKWERYKGRDILPLWVADMDFKSPPAVIDALHQRVSHGIFGYTIPSDDLIGALQARLQADYGWAIDADWLVWLPGLVTGLNVSCRAVGEDGDDVLTAIPVYPPFLSAPAHSRRKLKTVKLTCADNRWLFDFDRFEKAITPRTRLFILCNPHNPVGRVFTRIELVRLAAICAKHNMAICSDEIHCDLVLDSDKQHLPLATLDPSIAQRTITLMAPSKTYNLPGLGCSYAIIPNAKLRRRFQRAMDGIVPSVNLMGFSATLAALQDDRRWLKALRKYLCQNRALVFDAIEDMPGLKMNWVEATYLGWIDTRASGIQDPVSFFEKAGVGLSDGKAFGDERFLRLNFGCPRKTLATALQRMATALANRHGS
jgi:cystathionine beta-lyase